MKHWKCLVRAYECLWEEVPVVVSIAWLAAVLSPYVVAGSVYGSALAWFAFVFTLLASLILIVLSAALHEIFVVEGGFDQIRKLPYALKKCVACAKEEE